MNAPAETPARLRLRKRRDAATREAASRPYSAGSETATRVMIVDDSLTVRTIFKRMVESGGDMDVIGTASSAERAISLLKTVPADVVLLDLEMPGMGGLEALPAILETGEHVQVLVVSSLTLDGAEHTVSALSMGAADTMLKPRPGGFNEEYRTQLIGKIRALGGKTAETEEGCEVRADGDGSAQNEAKPRAGKPASTNTQSIPICTKLPELVAIGASTGGIHALNIMLREIPRDFPIPILITQHLPASFVPVFARQVELACGRTTVIAEEGTEIRRGEVVIATGDSHMIIRRVADRLVARTSAEPARSGCLPSVDLMLESAAHACDGHVLAVILSGMGRDGLEGAQELVRLGGAVFAQDPDTSAVWGMPGAVSKAGLSSFIAPPIDLAAAITAQNGKRAGARG